jgi:hypothetical protein
MGLMLKTIIIAATILRLSCAYAQLHTEGQDKQRQGLGKINTGDFIAPGVSLDDRDKKQLLLHAALMDVIEQEMKERNMDVANFKKNFELQFAAEWQKRLEMLQKKLGLKVGVDEEKIQNPHLKAKYREERAKLLREHTLQFGKIQEVLNSYALLGESQSTTDPLISFQKIQATLRSDLLGQLYFRFTSPPSSREGRFSALNFSVQIELEEGTEWEDISSVSSAEFSRVLSEHWKSDLFGKLASYPQIKIEMIDQGAVEKIHEHLAQVGLPALLFTTTPRDDHAAEAHKMYDQSLWLNMAVKIKKFNDSDTYQLKGLMSLSDLQRGEVILSKDFNTEWTDQMNSDRTIAEENKTDKLASRVFQQGQELLHHLPVAFNKGVLSEQRRDLLLVGQMMEMKKIFKIKEQLELVGGAWGLKVVPFIMRQDSVRLALNFTGKVDDLTSAISSWGQSAGFKVEEGQLAEK